MINIKRCGQELSDRMGVNMSTEIHFSDDDMEKNCIKKFIENMLADFMQALA